MLLALINFHSLAAQYVANSLEHSHAIQKRVPSVIMYATQTMKETFRSTKNRACRARDTPAYMSPLCYSTWFCSAAPFVRETSSREAKAAITGFEGQISVR